MSQLFASGGQSIGVSASTSVLIQDWFPLGWTGWISLQSKELSRVFSNTTVQKHQFFGTQGKIQFSSVTQSRPTLCEHMDYSTPVHHQLSEFTQTHVHPVGDTIQTSSCSVVPFYSCLQSFPASRSFPMSQFFASGDRSIRVSVSASVLPMNI